MPTLWATKARPHINEVNKSRLSDLSVVDLMDKFQNSDYKFQTNINIQAPKSKQIN